MSGLVERDQIRRRQQKTKAIEIVEEQPLKKRKDEVKQETQRNDVKEETKEETEDTKESNKKKSFECVKCRIKFFQFPPFFKAGFYLVQ